jgi:hypothetical protein
MACGNTRPQNPAYRPAHLCFVYLELMTSTASIVTRNFGWPPGQQRSGPTFIGLLMNELIEEARKIRNGLNGIKACPLVRRTVKVVDGKIGDHPCWEVAHADPMK